METPSNSQIPDLDSRRDPIFSIRREEMSTEKSQETHCPSTKQLFVYKRHDKSLYELSKKFFLKHWHLEEYIINLENLTIELDIERRRLYDIINILES